jgi:hypothetical protein
MEIIPVYCENYTKPINTFYGQNSELVNVKGDGTMGVKGFKCNYCNKLAV